MKVKEENCHGLLLVSLRMRNMATCSQWPFVQWHLTISIWAPVMKSPYYPICVWRKHENLIPYTKLAVLYETFLPSQFILYVQDMDGTTEYIRMKRLQAWFACNAVMIGFPFGSCEDTHHICRNLMSCDSNGTHDEPTIDVIYKCSHVLIHSMKTEYLLQNNNMQKY